MENVINREYLISSLSDKVKRNKLLDLTSPGSKLQNFDILLAFLKEVSKILILQYQQSKKPIQNYKAFREFNTLFTRNNWSANPHTCHDT